MSKPRLQIVLDNKKMDALEELVNESKGASKREIFNAALTLLQWAVRQRKAGRIIASLDESEGNYKELEMPILSDVTPDNPTKPKENANPSLETSS